MSLTLNELIIEIVIRVIVDITIGFIILLGLNYAKAQTGFMLGFTYSTAFGDIREQ